MADAWQSYIDVLTKTLNQQKERDISTMDSKLAARGIAQGGAYGAGINDISGKYADTLANTLAQIQLEKAKIDQTQTNALALQNNAAVLDRQKTYGYPGSPEADAANNTEGFGFSMTPSWALSPRKKGSVKSGGAVYTGSPADLYSSAI